MPESMSLSALAAATTGVVRNAADAQRLHLVVERAESVHMLVNRGFLEADAVVFAPRGVLGRRLDVRVIEYSGALDHPGDQFALDDRFVVEVQSYAVGQYLYVTGPLLLRITCHEDLLALAADARRALETGRLPQTLTCPGTHLADLPALTPTPGQHIARRLHVFADGSVAASAAGPRSHLEDEAHLPESSRTLAATVTADQLAEVRREAPALDRFLAVVAAVRAARACGLEVIGVSGFGSAWDAETPSEVGIGDPNRLVLAATDDRCLVIDPLTGRLVPLDRARAAAIERELEGAGDVTGRALLAAFAAKGFGAREGAAA